MTPEQIIKRPLVLTEKGNALREEENQYMFEVDRRANKAQIRGAAASSVATTSYDASAAFAGGALATKGARTRGGSWLAAT
jgi:large subunit ribosomal protein L23